MISLKKWIYIIAVASFLAISILGTTVADAVDKENVALSSLARTFILGVVGSAVLDRALESTAAASLSAPAL
mgnify:FL=1